MAIAVNGYGNITQSNAKEIYLAWRRGEVELDKSQQAKCESFLTPEDMDEIQYDTKSAEKQGADKINTEGTDKNSEAGAWVGTVSSGLAMAGSIVATCMGMKELTKSAQTNGFTSLGCSIPAAAMAVSALVFAFLFDSELKNREERSNNAGNDNQTMDGYTETLGANMDKMNEDAELYKNQQDELTTKVNEQTSQGASLQMEIDAAEAAGDTEKVKSLKEQLKALGEEDNSELTDGLDETRGLLDGYRAYNTEALGCAGAGQKVSDFLKQGKAFGNLAMANAIMATVATALLVVAVIVGAIPKIWTPAGPLDGPAAIASVVLWNVALLAMGTTAGIMWDTMVNEYKCSDSGDGMQEHVNTLNDMAEQQSAYVNDTEGSYDESDKGAAGSKEKGKKSADKAVGTNKDNLNADNNNTASQPQQ